MSAKVPLAPIVEEIANRMGFFDFEQEGPNAPLEITAAAVAGLRFFGEKLKLDDLAEHLPVEYAEDVSSVIFPQVIKLSEVPNWRRTTREFFRILSEENPRALGRWELSNWDKPRTPESGLDDLPLSKSFLDRSYKGEFIVREKKPMVADYRRSRRNYLASVDQDGSVPAVLLMDASSQIASHLLGFNGAALRGVLAHPESFQNLDYRIHDVPAEQALRAKLLRWSPPGIEHVVWCNSGTESWEKAVHLAHLKFPDKGPKCVCFKGSFHGRTLISLFSSWNPVKREPFQLKGYETLWAEFPEDKEPHIEKSADSAWLAHWEGAGNDDFAPPEVDAQEDPLLAEEVASLIEVRNHILTGEVSSVSVEPLQCEGGDRFATNRFFQTLRVMTRAMGVALIFDEVQTGFGLGGYELWSQSFDLKTSEGEPLGADFINLAKKCQVGAVLSSVEDPYPTSAHAASFYRGYVNASMVDAPRLKELGDKVRERLFELAAEYAYVTHPRAQGLAFAFDMPDQKHALNFVDQRFYHGFMVYIAGERTLRFRIQHTTSDQDLDHIFTAIHESLRHIRANGVEQLPQKYDYVWPDVAAPPHPVPMSVGELRTVNWDVLLRAFGELSGRRRQEMSKLLEPKPLEQYEAHYRERKFTWLEFLRYLAGRQSVRIRPLHAGNWQKYKDSIMELEDMVYEPGRRDSEEFLQAAVEADKSLSFVAFERDKLVGFSIAAPLRQFPDVKGPDQDPELKSGNYLYSADVLVHPEARGRGIGLRLKRRQAQRAQELGFLGIRSRNKVGMKGSMKRVNLSLGGVEIGYFPGDYSDGSDCRYLNLPLKDEVRPQLSWSSAIENPTGGLLPRDAWADWDLAAINKNSLCNWWTPNMTRYVEWLRALSPLGHVFLASGRDEAVDKLVKCLIHHRKGASKMVSFEGSFWGGVTACARSLSDERFGKYFDWAHVAYPFQEGDPFKGLDEPLTDREIDSLDQLSELLVEPESILGIAIEPIQEKTGRRVSIRFLQALRTLCDDTGIPLVMNESASWAYRGSRELFYCQATGVKPDLLTAFAGGQLGHVFCNDKYFIPKPLTLISTWDGDELSALRFREQMHVLRAHRDDPRLYELDKMIGPRGDTYRGSGLLYFDGEDLRCSEDLIGDGHIFWPALNRLDEAWDILEQLFSPQPQPAGV